MVSLCLPFAGLICGILAIVLGVAGKNEVDRFPHQRKGRGMATAGIVLGTIGVAFWVIVLGFWGYARFVLFADCDEDPYAPECEGPLDQELGSAAPPTGDFGGASTRALPWRSIGLDRGDPRTLGAS